MNGALLKEPSFLGTREYLKVIAILEYQCVIFRNFKNGRSMLALLNVFFKLDKVFVIGNNLAVANNYPLAYES